MSTAVNILTKGVDKVSLCAIIWAIKSSGVTGLFEDKEIYGDGGAVTWVIIVLFQPSLLEGG